MKKFELHDVRDFVLAWIAGSVIAWLCATMPSSHMQITLKAAWFSWQTGIIVPMFVHIIFQGLLIPITGVIVNQYNEGDVFIAVLSFLCGLLMAGLNLVFMWWIGLHYLFPVLVFASVLYLIFKFLEYNTVLTFVYLQSILLGFATNVGIAIVFFFVHAAGSVFLIYVRDKMYPETE